jgi:hypothetical protein
MGFFLLVEPIALAVNDSLERVLLERGWLQPCGLQIAPEFLADCGPDLIVAGHERAHVLCAQPVDVLAGKFVGHAHPSVMRLLPSNFADVYTFIEF